MTGTTSTDCYFGGAVAAFAFLRGAIDLDELREVAAVVQRVGDRGSVRREAIGGDLETLARRRVAQAFDENVRGALIALAHGDVQNQLGMPLDRDEGVAVAKVLIVLGPDTLFLLADEAPKLVGFHVAHFDVADLLGHDALALLASEHQQLQNRAVVDVGNALDARNAVAFEQELRTISAFSIGRYMPSRWLLLRLQERLGALAALEPLITFAVASRCAYIRSGRNGRSL